MRQNTFGVLKRRSRLGLTAIGAAAALVLAGCGGSTISGSGSGAGASGGAQKPCGTINLAVNPWVGYEADAAVFSYVAKTKLGCTVKEQNIAEGVSWQGFGTKTVDVILEDWGHPDLAKTYIDQQKVAEFVGKTGNVGQIGWFVPPWLVKKYPDITNWQNLNKYASMFKSSESGSAGAFLDGDPSYKTFDAALIKNLKLDYKVQYTGSETALITAYQQAEQKQTPVIGYWYTPQWFNSVVPMVKINLPKYTPGCDSDPAKVACDYASTPLQKVARTAFMNSGSPGATLVKNFAWTNDDQDLVAKYIANDKMTDEAAAQKWVDANPDKVNAWLAGTGAA